MICSIEHEYYLIQWVEEQIIHDLEVKIQNRGGKLIGNYVDYKLKIKVECNNGHIWETRPDSIITNNWCRICSGKSKEVSSNNIKEHPSERWIWRLISENINMDEVRHNPTLPWDKDGLSYQEDLTMDDINLINIYSSQ